MSDKQPAQVKLLHPLIYFPYLWFVRVPLRVFRFLGNLSTRLDYQFAAALMLKNLFVPLFGYGGIISYTITIPFRLVRGIGGFTIIILTNIFFLILLLAWLLLPLGLFILYPFYTTIALIIAWIGVALSHWEDPRYVITGERGVKNDWLDYAATSVQHLFENKKTISAKDVLIKLLQHKEMLPVLSRLGFENADAFLQEGQRKLQVLDGTQAKAILPEAYYTAQKTEDKHIETIHILLALLKTSRFQYNELLEVIDWLKKRRSWLYPPPLWSLEYDPGVLGGFNRAWTGRVTPTLDEYSWDVTVAAQKGQLAPLVGKQKPLEEALRVLEKTSRQNVIFVGQPGCGKTSLVYGLAQKIISGTEYKPLQDKRLISLDLGALSSGTKTGGDLTERLTKIIKEMEESKNIILFIDEVHNAISAGGGVETSVVFSTLEPHLANNNFQVIGATNWDNYRKYIEPNEAFARLFEVVEIPEASLQETLDILKRVSIDLERERGVTISYPALKSSVELSKSFIQDRVLPDKAVGVLEEAVVLASHSSPNKVVLPIHVEEIVSQKAKMPVGKVAGKETEILLNLEETMHQRLIGQEEAVRTAADAIRRARVGLRETDRPIASLLMVGPTGVGKTEMAKTLAEAFFGDEKRMVRLDMAEYQRQEGLAKLIGAPPSGGRGAEPGLLTDAIRKNPHALVLLDELEKAHPQILDIFLQVLDDGRLTDSSGRTVDFTHTIIMATSNAGTSRIYEGIRKGQAIGEMKQDIVHELESVFRIEFLNRFDGTIIFKPLTQPQIEKIARLKLNKITKTMAKDKNIHLKFTENLIKQIAIEGFDPALGARPLRRVIQDKLEAPLAKKILMGEIKEGEAVEIGEDILITP